MLLNPYRFGGGAGGTGPLDSYTANIWSAYAFQRLLGSYTGALVRIRNSTTTTETDIGYGVDNKVDQAAIASAIGSASATVVKFYDQTGNGRDLAQSTVSQQPRIVNAGTIDSSSGSVLTRFDGTDDCLITPNMSANVDAVTMVLYGQMRAFSGSFNVWLELGSGGGPDLGIYRDAGNSRCNIISGALNNFVFLNDTTHPPADDVTVVVGDRTKSVATDVCKYYKAGSQITPTGSAAGANSGYYVTSAINVGSRNNGSSLASQLNMKALVVYTAAKNGTDIAGISSGILI